jgi:hypothetical protein
MDNPEELATYGTLDKINVREYRRGKKNGQSREYEGAIKWTIQRIPKG